jgi:hypothetical protein
MYQLVPAGEFVRIHPEGLAFPHAFFAPCPGMSLPSEIIAAP